MPPKIIPSATSKPATVTFLLWTILRKKSKLNPNPSTIFFIIHDKNKEDTWEMENWSLLNISDTGLSTKKGLHKM